MSEPLVSVICLSYNHERFVTEAINSVLNQTYKNIEIIVVDDFSSDGSVKKITALVGENSQIKFLPLPANVGNCKAFNMGLKMSAGEFIIDFATDDVMLPERVKHQVDFFSGHGTNVGVVFTDATYIDEEGMTIRHHYDHLLSKGLITRIPQGDVYTMVLSRYFICSPTMMIRRYVLDTLKGYDESLSYEDFDFWVRASRLFHFAFLNERLTRVRKLTASMSTGWYVQGDRQLHSTYVVCRKAKQLNQSDEDRRALCTRVQYELRQSVFSENTKEADLFYDLLHEIRGVRMVDRLYRVMGKLHLPLKNVRRWYHAKRYGAKG